MQTQRSNVCNKQNLLIPKPTCGGGLEANSVGNPTAELFETIVTKLSEGLVAPRTTKFQSPVAKQRLTVSMVELINEFPMVGDEEFGKCCASLIVIDEIYELFFSVMIDKRKMKPSYKTSSKQKLFRTWYSPEMMAKKQKAKAATLKSCLRFVSTAPGTGLWIKFFKDLTCNFYSVWYSQDVTTTPQSRFRDGWRYPLGGPYRKLTQKLLKHKYIFDFFAETMLRAKMGMPKASEDLILAAVEKTFVALTSTPKIPMDEVVTVSSTSVFWLPDSRLRQGRPKGTKLLKTKKVVVVPREKKITQRSIEKQGRRTVRELFYGTEFTPTDMSKPFFPSTSSNYINSRSKGGAVGFIQDELLKMKKELLVDFVPMEVEIRGEITRKYGDRGLVEQATFDAVPDCELNIKCSSSTLQGRTHFVNGSAVNLERFESTWKNLYWNMYQKAIDEDPLVEPVGLAEFLKVRVITKGPPLTYTVLKPFQKFLWGVLRRYPAFKLIGEVVTAEYMYEILGRLNEDEEFTSGDYQASTDNLHSWLTEAIVDEMFKCFLEYNPGYAQMMPSSFRDMVVRALTKHIFVRKDDDGNVTERLPQLEGQLMGSIISFPFLCIANAAMCRYALELDQGRKYRLGNDPSEGPLAPIMINGDDCAIKASPRFRDIWRKVTRIGGLLESQGKTYFSREFVVINSERFNYTEANDNPYESQPYVNFGLINGCKKGTTQEETWVEKLASIGTRHQELMKWCPDYSKPLIHELFMRKWSNFLKTYASDIPWYLPTWLGGLGLVDIQNRLSKIDRMLGSIVLHEWDKLKPRNLTKAPEWQMHDRVASRLTELNVSLENCSHAIVMSDCPNDPRDLIDENARLYTALVIETLFCCNNLQKDCKTVKDKNDQNLLLDAKLLSGINHNRHVYQKANDIMKQKKVGKSRYANYRPLENNELELEKKETILPVFIY